MSDAVWIISESVVAVDLIAGGLHQLPIDMGATLGPIGITTRSEAELTLPGQAMIECIRGVAAARSDEVSQPDGDLPSVRRRR
jgi:LysR family pca operon transcriptional activator